MHFSTRVFLARLLFAAWCLEFGVSSILGVTEYELSGFYEYSDNRPDPVAKAEFDKWITDHTPAVKSSNWWWDLKGEFERLHGPLSIALKQYVKPLGEDFNREFKVLVRGNSWCIHTRRRAWDWEYGCEHSGDGKELAMSLKYPGGVPMGWIGTRPYPVPHSLSDFGAAIVWAMTASGGYLDTVTNNLVIAAHDPPPLAKPGELQPEYGQPCTLIRWDAVPGLPVFLAFHSADGKTTNALYRAIGFREFGRLSLPSGFLWEQYGGMDYKDGIRSLRVITRIEARITNFVATCNRQDLRARVIPGMQVADYRVKPKTNAVAEVAPQTPPSSPTNTAPKESRAPILPGYNLRDKKWPSVAKAQDMVDGRKRTAKTWIVAAVGAVVLLGGAVWWLRRRWRRPFTPVRPPADVPGA